MEIQPFWADFLPGRDRRFRLRTKLQHGRRHPIDGDQRNAPRNRPHAQSSKCERSIARCAKARPQSEHLYMRVCECVLICALRLGIFANSRPQPGCGHLNFFPLERAGGLDVPLEPLGPLTRAWMEIRCFCDFVFAFALSMLGQSIQW